MEISASQSSSGAGVQPVMAPLRHDDGSRFARRLFLVLGSIALIYALLAGLRTVTDPDLGWQMATGRWIVQHHQIPSTDVFSYTAYGRPWIYPVGSGLLFYALYLLGGYALLSWLGAAACVGTTALLLRRGSAFTAAIAIIAIPLIASRTTPRSDMFTVVLFAAYLSVLWENYQTGRAALWALPLMMLAWVNLHLGFIAGLGLIGAFVALEVLRMLSSAEQRREGMLRLRRALPWYVATALATLINPWGWELYRAIIRQNRAMALHSQMITEWAQARWNWSAPLRSLSLIDAKGSLNLLVIIVVLAALAAAWQRRLGLTLLLLGAMYETTRHVRMEALTACIVVVIAGAVLFDTVPQLRSWIPNPRMRSVAAVAAVALFAVLAAIRSTNVVTDRAYLGSNSSSSFGAGFTWWFPQRAADFILRENLPGRIYNTYDDGGYLDFKLGPKYQVYFDGRAIPFGIERFAKEQQLLVAPIDSPTWLDEADRYGINTLLIPLATSEVTYDRLKDFCYSSNWRPVYLDEIAIVLVRRTPQNQSLLDRLGIDCAIAPLPSGPVPNNARGFYQWLNTAYVLTALGRTSEALSASDHALKIFPDNSGLHWIRGTIYYARDRHSDAEQEWLTELALQPGDSAVLSRLAEMYQEQGRTADAMHALQQVVRESLDPITKARALVKVAQISLAGGQPQAALQALNEAEQVAPPVMLQVSGGRSFKFDLAQGRAAIWRSMGDASKAIAYQEQAVQLDPKAADAWRHLANLYQQEGRTGDQQQAEAKAAALAGSPAQ